MRMQPKPWQKAPLLPPLWQGAVCLPSPPFPRLPRVWCPVSRTGQQGLLWASRCPKKADLELPRPSTPVGFSRLQEPLQVCFILKLQPLSFVVAHRSFPLPGVTFLSRWGSWPIKALSRAEAPAAQGPGHPSISSHFSQPFISQSDLLLLCNHRKTRWKPRQRLILVDLFIARPSLPQEWSSKSHPDSQPPRNVCLSLKIPPFALGAALP